MPYSSCAVHMEFVDVTAIEDATVTTSDNMEFGNLALFKDRIEGGSYGTLELNQFVLDGSREEFPDEPDSFAFFSAEKSDKNGNFSSHPQLTVTFTSPHTSAGIKLFFCDSYPGELKLTWYGMNGEKLQEQTYYPDALNYFCKKQIKNYGKIVIEFLKTALPERYIKLQYIKYGVEIDWEDDVIISAKMTEEIDVTNETLSINTAEISIIDEENDFDLQNQDGTWISIQSDQQLKIVEEADGKTIECGSFFVSKWSSKDNEITFSLVDPIGLLDKTNFYDGQIYYNVPAGEIIDAIMQSAGVSKYEVADDVAAILLSGHLAIQSHREALHQVCFATGAVADDSRSDIIRIYIPDRAVSATIGTDRQFMGNEMELDDYVSDVSVTYSRYTLNTDEDLSEIYNDVLPVGVSRIEFTDPYKADTLTATGGTVQNAHTNYCDILMEEAGECVLSGRAYDAADCVVRASVDVVDAGETANIKEYTGLTLLNADQARTVAENILHYLQLRQIVTMEYINDGEGVGNWCNIASTNGYVATTGMVSQTIDLAGGNLASSKSRGYSVVVTDFYYTGTELYAGGGGII
jgi:hypothetical protein